MKQLYISYSNADHFCAKTQIIDCKVSFVVFSESLERPNIEAILEEAANRVREEARVSVEHQGQIKLAFGISCANLTAVLGLSLKLLEMTIVNFHVFGNDYCLFSCLEIFYVFDLGSWCGFPSVKYTMNTFTICWSRSLKRRMLADMHSFSGMTKTVHLM